MFVARHQLQTVSFSLAALASLLAQSELTAVHHLTKGEVLYDG